jgi:tetratricopeptide (TPR) repeat protein
MASVQAKMGKAGAAVDFLTHALFLDSGAIGDALAIGDVFFDAENYDAAMAVYQLARQYADGAQIFHKLGQAALKLERPEEAVAYYEEGLRRHPDDPDLKEALEEARKNLNVSGMS